MSREERDERGPDEPRDERDERRPDDPRDARDPHQPGDEVESITPRFVKWIAVIIAMGLGTLAFTAWQVSSLRAEELERLCERAVVSRDDQRSVWLFLLNRESERRNDPDVVEFIEFLNRRLPRLECVDSAPTPKE